MADVTRGLSEQEREIVKDMLATLESFDDTLAGWEIKVDAGTQGVTMRFKFGKKCGVYEAIKFANCCEQSTFKLAQMLDRALRLDDDVKALEAERVAS